MKYPVSNFETDWNTTAGNGFGDKVSYGYHEGVDLNINGGGNTDLGQPLYAIADYEITSVHEHATGFGKHIHYLIKGDFGERYVHYAHCNEIFVKVGDKGKEGDRLATLGNTGNSTYAHCHWVVKNRPTGIDSVAKTQSDLEAYEDPVAFVKKYIGQSSSTQVIIDQLREERDRNWTLYKSEEEAHSETRKKVGDLENDKRNLDNKIRDAVQENKNLHQEIQKADEEIDEAIGAKIKAEDALKEAQITLEIVCKALDIPVESKREEIAQRIANIKAPEDETIKHYESIIEQMWKNLIRGKKTKSVIDKILSWFTRK